MKKVNKIRLLIASGSLVAIGSANAALDAGVTTAVGSAGTDGAALGALVLVAIVGIYSFKLMRRAL